MAKLYTTKNVRRVLNDKAFKEFKQHRKEGLTIKQAFKKVTTRNIS